eukprot:CAMPEP_0171321936 /NCGR_PEP_ID=MMETSP0816-20121228/114657_1 /TAXON_ID=420281 /ORGANISM="Proboscia inermis, Strain CCAP1064/1" /LENGTH=422 /DNA_ID=CAMNT_0011820309 /DNA_START=35 /DNA_END=1303 /DNA_ORIENTATION=+
MAQTLLMPFEASSTLVNVAEDAELRIIHLLATNSSASTPCPTTFVPTCEACIANADASGLLNTILDEPGAVRSLFGFETVEECVGAFSLLASLLDRISDAQESQRMTLKLADTIGAGGGNGDGKKCLAMLVALYNFRSDGSEKCHLLAKIVTLAASVSPELLNSSGALGTFIEPQTLKVLEGQWNIEVAERRNLYKAVIGAMDTEALDATKAKTKQQFLLLHLSTFDESSAFEPEALEAARNAAVGAIRDPVSLFNEQRGIIRIPAIQALGKKKDTKLLLKLLEIFSSGKLEDFLSFLSTNPNILTQFNLVHEECIRYMRILSLCSLADEHEEIPYAAVASTLQVPLEDVESWVISGVSSGLLVAKMDQLQQLVMVERCVVRKFGIEQWKLLQTKMDAWKSNVRGILEGLKRSQAIQAQLAV